MANQPKFGKGALIVAMLVAAVGGIWFGRCTRNAPAEARSTSSAWAPASTPSGSSTSSSGSAENAQVEPIPHFDVTENKNFKGGISLRDLDRDIFAKLNDLDHLKREDMKDVFPDKPYLVRFIGSVATKNIGYVLVDMNRDGKIDERWEIRDGSVRRTVPNDPNAADTEVRYQLGQGKWQVR